MPTNSQGIVNAGDPRSSPIPRRRFVEVLLGSGFLATAVAFLYPVLRYLVPPKATDLGSMSWIQRPLPYPGSVLGEPSGRTRQCRNRPVPGMVS
jgi:hypothetical protein